MGLLLDDLAEPFERMPVADIRTALGDVWGLDASQLEQLDTERDDTYRAETAQGIVTIKIAHPSDPPAVIDLQVRAMQHVAAADPEVPVQPVVPTRDGEPTALVGGRVARVLGWIDGDLLDEVDTTPELLTEAGRMHGRLHTALAGFDHPAADRDLAWDLPRLPELLSAATEPLHVEVMLRFAAETVPALAALPRQVIHNDLHPSNLLVSGGRVTGILDFGDVLRSSRAADLGVALAYLAPSDDAETWDDVRAFRAGFESVVTLLPDERALLRQLMAARTIMRIVVNRVLHRDRGEELDEFYARNERRLRRILTDEI